MTVELDELAKGLVAGVVTERIRSTTRLALIGLVTVVVATLMVAIVLDGWLAGLFAVVAVAALLLAAAVWLLRRLAVAAIRRVAEPEDLRDHRGAVTAAIDKADLPTGPLSAMRFGWRLRKGATAEAQRMASIVSSLRSRLEA